jgi:hypothetical protein
VDTALLHKKIMDKVKQFGSEFEKFIRRIGHDEELFQLAHIRLDYPTAAAFLF